MTKEERIQRSNSILEEFNNTELTCDRMKPNRVGDWFLDGPPMNLIRAPENVYFMGKAPGELETQYHAIEECRKRGGKVLTTGLGIGMFVDYVLLNDNVESITVIEKYQEVIDLVAPYLKDRWGDRLIIIKADALEYVPDQRYTVIWHDIWANQFAAENTADCRKIKEVYAPYCDWQGFWQTHG